jgi:hypothetical protein
MAQKSSHEWRQPSGLNRRHFLRGVGACVALPALETMLPSFLRAAEATAPATAAAEATAGAAAATPVRMGFVYFPNGALQKPWWPKSGEGKDFVLGDTMTPLEKVKHQIQVMGGLDHVNATPGPDGAGDHARANGTFLTGVRVRKTAGSDIFAGVSIDQVAADKIGHLTRFPSLELSCEPARRSGNCDSGYSCAYQYNLAWRSPTAPVAPEANPRLVFERLFGAGSPEERKSSYKFRQQQQQSVLDFVREDARSLQNKLGGRDKDKLDDYLTSVRDIEKRIELAEKKFGDPKDPNVDTPAGIPPSYKDHIALMFDMLLLAFQTDSTRIGTLLLAHDGSNRPFPELDISAGHHDSTHHQGNPEKIARVAQIDNWYMQQFASFLEKMEATKEPDGTSLLHHSMIVYGCGNSDGNRHTHDNLPIVLAGGGGGALTPGRYVKHGGVPACNLFLSMLDRMGADGVERFGDSTARLPNV